MTETPPDSLIARDPLALAMFAAWVNLPVDKLPEAMRAHTCPATATAWKRVAEAARQTMRECPTLLQSNRPTPT